MIGGAVVNALILSSVGSQTMVQKNAKDMI